MTKRQLKKPIAVTAGEPAGIGPDLCIALANSPWASDIVVIGDPEMLAERAELLGTSLSISEYKPDTRSANQGLKVLSQPLRQSAECGQLNPLNSQSLLDGIERAVSGCQSGEFSAMVTAPLQKSVIIDAGITFTGHTEFLAELTSTPMPVMLLAADKLRVALASTHLPLKDVPAYLTSERIAAVIEVLNHDLRTRFRIEKPRIIVCGLNPHAGESGHLGSEDGEIILPAIVHCQSIGIDAVGPLPADTAFTPLAGHADAILAMFHDQGLPVIKYAGFGTAVNVTLGLPIIRTSVDHGTALDLAGKGIADSGSMMAAVELAVSLATES